MTFDPTFPPPATMTYIRRSSLSASPRGRCRGAPRSRSASGRRCSCRDRSRASRGPGRGCERRRSRCRSAAGAPGRSRCSCCRRSSRRRRRRHRRHPACSSTVTSIPCPTTNPPRQPGPSRPSASSFSSTTVTSQPSAASPLATAEPTRPHPITTAFTAAAAYSSNTAVGERDDEHLAGRLAQHEVDGRREESRLPSPARRRAEHDEVGVPPRRLVDDRMADRARAHDVAVHLDAVVGAERASLLERRVDAGGDLRRQLALELELARHAHDRDRLDLGAALLRERDRRRDHLLADVAELHRDEDALELARRREARPTGMTCSSRPRRRVRRTSDEDDETGERARPGLRSALPGA